MIPFPSYQTQARSPYVVILISNDFRVARGLYLLDAATVTSRQHILLIHLFSLCAVNLWCGFGPSRAMGKSWDLGSLLSVWHRSRPLGSCFPPHFEFESKYLSSDGWVTFLCISGFLWLLAIRPNKTSILPLLAFHWSWEWLSFVTGCCVRFCESRTANLLATSDRTLPCPLIVFRSPKGAYFRDYQRLLWRNAKYLVQTFQPVTSLFPSISGIISPCRLPIWGKH